MESDDPFAIMNGSTGLPGGADAGFILKRERGQNEATLHFFAFWRILVQQCNTQ